MDISFRTAKLHDLECLVGLINSAYEVEAFFVVGPRVSSESVREKIAAGKFLVASHGAAQQIVGCVLYEAREGHGYFGLLAVDPTAQGRKLGQRLIEQVEARARSQGLPAMRIHVVDLREELVPWYERQGYVQVGTKPFDEGNRQLRPCKFLIYEKPLDR